MNSIQLGLTQAMRLMVTGRIDHPTGTLMLHALQMAAANLKQTSPPALENNWNVESDN